MFRHPQEAAAMPQFRKSHLGKSGAALIGAILLLGSSVASAQDAPSPDSPKDLAIEGLRNLIQALDLFVKSVPQYSAPEVLPNGDIIIRRIRPADPPSETAPKPALPDETHT
jgi:hypothetical protein